MPNSEKEAPKRTTLRSERVLSPIREELSLCIDMVKDIVNIYPNPDAWYTLLTGGYTARKAAITLPPAQRSFLQKLYEDDEKVLVRHIHSFLHKPRYLENLNYLDREGKTAAQQAHEKGHAAIVKLLKDKPVTIRFDMDEESWSTPQVLSDAPAPRAGCGAGLP